MSDEQDEVRGTTRRKGGRVGVLVALIVGLVVVGAVAVLTIDGGPDGVGVMTPSVSPAPTASRSPSATMPPDGDSASVPPGEGTLTVSPGGVGEVPTTALDLPQEPVPGFRVEIAAVEAVDGTSGEPGQIAGPALRATVRVSNASGTDLDLRSAVVNAYAGPELTPVSLLSGPGLVAFPPSVAPGAAAEAVFVWNVPIDQRARFRVEVDTAFDVDIVAFEGDAS